MGLSLKLARPIAAAGALIVVATQPSCKDKDVPPAPPASAASSASVTHCPEGRSVDPPKAEFRPAIGAFQDQRYAVAQKLLGNLAEKYPDSATTRVWLGDAVLYDESKPYVAAADEALRHYQRADELVRAGCKLREAMAYYLRMGLAYAYLRKDSPDKAHEHLELAVAQWPESAEVHYHSARVACLRKDHDACLKHLDHTFDLAQRRVRPLFLRVHRSLDDWFVRADSQSEFAELRQLKAAEFQRLKDRYRALPVAP